MNTSELAKELLFDHEHMRTLRSGYDAFLTDIAEYVRPSTASFYNTGEISPVTSNVRCYDSTAMWSAEQLAAGYAGFLIPSNDRWADVIIDGDEKVDRDGQIWLDMVSDLMFKEYANPRSRFISSMQEDFYDLSGFGSSVLYQDYNYKTGNTRFRAYPLTSCWMAENNDGFIDVMHRSTNYTTRQLYQEFDSNVLNAIEQVVKDQAKNLRTWEIIHIVRPNTDKLSSPYKVKKKFMSVYIIRQLKEIVKLGGYNYFPYQVGREKVVPGHVYGQSCAFTMLPAIKMLNAMMRTVIKSANKAIDPPIMAPSEGFIVPLNSDAGALWWYDAATMNPEAVKQFDHRGNFQISDNIIQDVRDQITRGFHVDWLIRNKKNERQTATEIMDDRDEMLRQLSPTLGRVETEKIANIVKTTYYLMNQAGRIPQAPTSLSKKKLDIRFQSPTARAQYGARGADIQRYVAEITPMINLYPSMADTLDPDALSEYIARIRNVPAIIMRDEQSKMELRQQKEQEAQTQQMIQGAPLAASALKDVASAQQMGGGM
jgi:hypothetical protein